MIARTLKCYKVPQKGHQLVLINQSICALWGQQSATECMVTSSTDSRTGLRNPYISSFLKEYVGQEKSNIGGGSCNVIYIRT